MRFAGGTLPPALLLMCLNPNRIGKPAENPWNFHRNSSATVTVTVNVTETVIAINSYLVPPAARPSVIAGGLSVLTQVENQSLRRADELRRALQNLADQRKVEPVGAELIRRRLAPLHINKFFVKVQKVV